jgi:hypothetical protein
MKMLLIHIQRRVCALYALACARGPLSSAGLKLKRRSAVSTGRPEGAAYLYLPLQPDPVRVGRGSGCQGKSICRDDLGQLVDFAIHLFALYHVPSFQEVRSTERQRPYAPFVPRRCSRQTTSPGSFAHSLEDFGLER